MALFRIEWKESARKELKKLKKSAILRIIEAVEDLAKDPNPPRSTKLRGSKKTYRIRIGDYRVLYSIHSGALVIEVVRVGHRKDVYRWLT